MAENFTKSYVNKSAVITPSSFSAPASLSREEADKFIDYVVDMSFMKKNARIERMSAPTKTIAKVGIGQKILKPAKSAQDPGNTVSITTDQLTLETKEIIAIAEVSDDSLEDNIEGDAFVDHLMQMIAAQSANELDLMAMYGKRIAQPNDATDIRQLVNGWVTIARENGHLLNARDTGLFADDKGYIDPTKLSKIVKTIPQIYRGNKGNLRMLIADDIYQDYNDYLGARAVSTADPYLLGVGKLTYSNIPLQPVSLMPVDRPIVKIGGGNTVLSNAPQAGTSLLQVADAANIAEGDFIVLDLGGGYEEVLTVAAVVGNNITVNGTLYYAHAAGTTVKEITADGSDLLLTDYRNLIFGIQRDIKWETERHPRRRSTSFVMTMRVDTQIENADAMVVMTGLKSK
jgi:hypothetical protein